MQPKRAVALRQPPNKQLQRTVIPHCWTRGRAEAELSVRQHMASTRRFRIKARFCTTTRRGSE